MEFIPIWNNLSDFVGRTPPVEAGVIPRYFSIRAPFVHKTFSIDDDLIFTINTALDSSQYLSLICQLEPKAIIFTSQTLTLTIGIF